MAQNLSLNFQLLYNYKLKAYNIFSKLLIVKNLWMNFFFRLDESVTCPICCGVIKDKYSLNGHFETDHQAEGGCCVECLTVVKVTNQKWTTFYVIRLIVMGLCIRVD